MEEHLLLAILNGLKTWFHTTFLYRDGMQLIQVYDLKVPSIHLTIFDVADFSVRFITFIVLTIFVEMYLSSFEARRKKREAQANFVRFLAEREQEQNYYDEKYFEELKKIKTTDDETYKQGLIRFLSQ